MRNIAAAFYLLIVLMLQSNFLSAQQIDSALKIYSSQFQQEKIHIHFDKSIYTKGETIWFKAYLMAGSELSDYSTNFYVDVFDANGNLLKHCFEPIFQSSAKGQFTIPADYSFPSIHIRAYTQWMLNFDAAFLYNKDISIFQNKNSNKENIQPITTLQFFPEGGDLLADIETKIAFKATDQFGKPVKITGNIKNSKDSVTASFASEHDGMGSILLQAAADETYIAHWKDENGISGKTILPALKKNGATIQVQQLSSTAFVQIQRTPTAVESLQNLHLLISMHQHLLYKAAVNLKEKSTSLAEISTESFPTGIVQISLFNADWIPIAERVIFVNNHEHEFFPEISTPVIGLNKRNKNSIEISVPDSIQSNLSIAVTDAGLSNENNNIISQLLLCGDLKGYINNPAYYFSSDADTVSHHLDLLMLTHGWRRYNWDAITHNKFPILKYNRDTTFLQVKGNITTHTNSDFPSDQKIILVMQANDSTNKTFIVPVKRDGSFEKNNIVFADSIKLFYQLADNKKWMGATDISFHTNLIPIPKNFIDYSISKNTDLYGFDENQNITSIHFLLEQIRLKKIAEKNTLPDAVVKTKIKRSVDLLDEKYASKLFKGDAIQFDVQNDPRKDKAISLFHYLQGLIPGMQIFIVNPSTMFLYWRDERVSIFLDEVPSNSFDPLVSNLQMDEIAYIKVFRPPFTDAPFSSTFDILSTSGAGGAIAIYTKKGEQTKQNITQDMKYTIVEGYTEYKQFYSPDYSKPSDNFLPDLRTTLYWNPYIITTSKNKKVLVEFYNNDSSKKLKIIIEGMNAAGKLARTEKLIE